jgi:hypothetical protein
MIQSAQPTLSSLAVDVLSLLQPFPFGTSIADLCDDSVGTHSIQSRIKVRYALAEIGRHMGLRVQIIAQDPEGDNHLYSIAREEWSAVQDYVREHWQPETARKESK